MARLRISLANKCQLLFGLAVVLILTAALAVPWLRMQKLVDESQQEIAAGMAGDWLADLVDDYGALPAFSTRVLGAGPDQPHELRFIPESLFTDESAGDAWLTDKLLALNVRPGRELFEPVRDPDRGRLYQYLRAVRQSDLDRLGGGFSAEVPISTIADPVLGVVIVTMDARWADRQLLFNRIYIVIAGLLAGLLAIVAFWFITTRIILSPVRVLRSTAEKVTEGDLNIQADINTGDEFEQLSDAFNAMLANQRASQDQMAALNKQLDLKLGELAETNVSLFEANKLKSDFLANVSHELRTPLNSIIGFAEVLGDQLNGGDDADEKRLRYVKNIEHSSRSLLVLINDLLDLAKIEAGRIDLHVEPMVVKDTCEALVSLIRPQAEAKQIELDATVAPGLPVINTDAGKVQQVLFNFLANAVKFTPDAGKVALIAEPVLDSSDQVTGVRFSVADTGPGIALEYHEEVFEKFRQLDQAHTKSYGGTGLGLAISRELAQYLNATIELDSDAGRGATFSLLVPLSLEQKSEPLMPDLVE